MEVMPVLQPETVALSSAKEAKRALLLAKVLRVAIFRLMVVSAVLAAALCHCSAATAAQHRAAACRSLRLMAGTLVAVAPYRCARAHRAAARAALCLCVPGLPRVVMAALSVSPWVLVRVAQAGWSHCLPVRLLVAAVVLCLSYRAQRRAKVRLEAVSLSLQVALMPLRVAGWSCSAARARAARVVLCRCALLMQALLETVVPLRCAPDPRVLATQAACC